MSSEWRRMSGDWGSGGPGGPPAPMMAEPPFLRFKPIIIVAIVVFLIAVILSVGQQTFVLLNREDPEKILAIAGTLGTVSCVCGFLMDALAGLIYTRIGRSSGPIGLGGGAAGGAITAGAARLLSLLVGNIVGLVVLPIFLKTSGGDAAVALGAGIVGAIGGTCLWTLVGAGIGALGGLIGAAIWGKPS